MPVDSNSVLSANAWFRYRFRRVEFRGVSYPMTSSYSRQGSRRPGRGVSEAVNDGCRDSMVHLYRSLAELCARAMPSSQASVGHHCISIFGGCNPAFDNHDNLTPSTTDCTGRPQTQVSIPPTGTTQTPGNSPAKGLPYTSSVTASLRNRLSSAIRKFTPSSSSYSGSHGYTSVDSPLCGRPGARSCPNILKKSK